MREARGRTTRSARAQTSTRAGGGLREHDPLPSLSLPVPADVVPRRRRLSEGCSDLAGQVLSAAVRLLPTSQRQKTHSICLRLGWDTLCLGNLSCGWSDRAVKRLETARAQKVVAEATKVIKQQELHKSLRVRW